MRGIFPWVFCLSCTRHEAPVESYSRPPSQSSPSEASAPGVGSESESMVLTGRFEEGLFLDDHLDFYIETPEGWEVHAGPGDGNLRVSMTEVQTGLRVEVWAFGGIAFDPRPREDCVWKFKDSGGYRVLHMADPVTISTCVPDEPSGSRVFGYLLIRESWTWQLEVHVPSTAPLDSLHRGEQVLSTARWGTRSAP